ncbi:MAG: ABC transporter substrate-binding protein [Bdellovibrionaceae bacterium]|nr:ABC transporter substrate-binding protein [Pseudobdellovibrionaceae bacterium]
MVKNRLNILMSDTNIAPYAENASGGMLATFNAAVLGQLIETDESFNLTPGLLEIFEFDYLKSAYILRLKKGLKFHNGREATSKDLEFALLRGFFSKNSSFYRVYLVNLKGIEKVNPKDNFTSGKVAGIKVIDNLTVEVNLSSPNPSFLHVLTNPYFSLVPIEELKEDYITWKNVPIGVGPYKVVGQGFKDSHVKLELIDKSIKGPSSVNIYTFPVSDVKFDIISQGHSDSIKLGYIKEETHKPKSMRTIFFSNSNPLGQDINFKRAIHNLLDRQDFSSDKYSILPASQMLPRHFWGRSLDGFKSNLDKAKELINKIPNDLLVKQWEVPFFGANQLSDYHKYISQKLSSQFSKIGLKVKFVTTTEKFPSKEFVKEFPMWIASMVTDYLDPLIMFSAFRSDSAFGFIHPLGRDSVNFDSLYKEAANAKTMEERIKSIKSLSEFVKEQAVAVAIGEEKGVYYRNSSTIISLGDQPQPLVLFIKNIELKY